MTTLTSLTNEELLRHVRSTTSYDAISQLLADRLEAAMDEIEALEQEARYNEN